jgi:hypothetical protein
MMTLEELIRRGKMTRKGDFRHVWAKELKDTPKNSDIWKHLTDQTWCSV